MWPRPLFIWIAWGTMLALGCEKPPGVASQAGTPMHEAQASRTIPAAVKADQPILRDQSGKEPDRLCYSDPRRSCDLYASFHRSARGCR